jgi:hypothetical protein
MTSSRSLSASIIVRRVITLATAVLLLSGAVVQAAAAAPPRYGPSASIATPPPWVSGVYAGSGPSGDLNFGAWRGDPVQTGTDYLPQGSWDAITNPTWAIQHWGAQTAITPVLSMPLWPQSGGSLAAAASGAYNDHFATLAKNLVAGGLSHSVLRIAWEFNAPWYRWHAGNAAQAVQFAQAWRQIVGAMQAVPGQHFSFDWCSYPMATSYDLADAYPGDAYVTEIGSDVYDWSSVARQSPADRWSALVHGPNGLAWQANFAAAHHKPLSFPEWGLVSKPLAPSAAGNDDPAFVLHMYDWFRDHNLAFEDYFDSDNSPNAVFYGLTTGNGQFPKATALYQKLF